MCCLVGYSVNVREFLFCLFLSLPFSSLADRYSNTFIVKALPLFRWAHVPERMILFMLNSRVT